MNCSVVTDLSSDPDDRQRAHVALGLSRSPMEPSDRDFRLNPESLLAESSLEIVVIRPECGWNWAELMPVGWITALEQGLDKLRRS